MNELLRDAFQHNSWATKELLTTCRKLTPEQLNTSTIGSFGTILETFNHFINSDARYQGHLSGNYPEWSTNRQIGADFDELMAHAEENEQLWEELLSQPIDAKRELILDNGTYRTHVGVVIAQALHHGTLHREQICAILTQSGIEAPDLQPWSYADATGAGRLISNET